VMVITRTEPISILEITPTNQRFSKTTDICYVSNILTLGSEVVISFFNRANPFFGVCPFRFDDICKMIRVDSGCAYGKIHAINHYSNKCHNVAFKHLNCFIILCKIVHNFMSFTPQII